MNQLTVEQCQLAVGALEKIWEALPRSERAERKTEHLRVRDTLLAIAASSRGLSDQVVITDAQGGGDEDGDEDGDEYGDEDDETVVSFVASALRSASPEDLLAIDVLVKIRALDAETRSEVFYELSSLFCTDCGEVLSDAEADPEGETEHKCALDPEPPESEDSAVVDSRGPGGPGEPTESAET